MIDSSTNDLEINSLRQIGIDWSLVERICLSIKEADCNIGNPPFGAWFSLVTWGVRTCAAHT